MKSPFSALLHNATFHSGRPYCYARPCHASHSSSPSRLSSLSHFGRLIQSALLCLMVLVVSACSSGPDESILENRLAATIDLGWGWVKAENVSLEKKEDTESGIMGTFSYTLVIQKDAHLLPPEAITTFRTYVPQCRSVPIQKGKRCSLEETLLFVESTTFGWVPDVVVQQRPELLVHIADKAD